MSDTKNSVEQPGVEQRLGRLVTGREVSMFQEDIDNNLDILKSKLDGSRVLVVGGAGSIGSETTKLLARFELDALHIVDHSENYLADLIRDIRSDYRPPKAKNIRALPISYSATQMRRFLGDSKPYNFVLNFAALKHVRSEKDVYSLFQMLDTNIVGHARFKSWLKKPEGLSRYFAVSTDKASNPTSLMGASKRIMEDIAFDCSAGSFDNTTSARFANVAFSNGSLPLSFLDRISKHHPLAAPQGCRRYFITLEEAGQICLLAGFMLDDALVALPNLDPEEHLIPLQDVATIVLKDIGYEPEFFDDEAEAKSGFAKLHAEKRWPVLLTPLDTAGEKPYEEFLAENEVAIEVGLNAINGTTHIVNPEIGRLVGRLEELIHGSVEEYSVEAVVELIAQQIGTFRHVQSQKCLDDRM